MKRKRLFVVILSCFINSLFAQDNRSIWLDSLNLETMETGWGQPHANATINGRPLSLGGIIYPHGVGTHASSVYDINLFGMVLQFDALVGIDDEVEKNPGSANFKVYKDGLLVFESGVLREHQTPSKIKIDLRGANHLRLVVDDLNDSYSWDHADWCMAVFTLKKGAEKIPAARYRLPSKTPYVLTPTTSFLPRINGPSVYGARPEAEFMYRVPVTGKEPIIYQANGLPEGLFIDDHTGIISGTVHKKGSYSVMLKASNEKGEVTRAFEIRIGDTIALTPPMGWNSWNCFDTSVDEQKIKLAADAFIQKGLYKHGWTYINIDDAWQGERDSTGHIQGNQKFPDMRSLGNYIHQRGLKFGVYSSPGKLTCAHFAGSLGYEQSDANSYARWGVDYLKYDWCSCTGPDLKTPYSLMDGFLRKTNRDIIYSLCQYGMGDVWKWGVQVGGNLWRTSGDIDDSWGSLNIGFNQNGMEPYAGPGHWNDADMMIVGWVSTGSSLHPTRLRPDEQYTHVTLWSILAAPMLIGCDLSKLDDFTISLLTNDEVLEVNQDALGVQGRRVYKNDKKEIWAKPLSDGSYAIAFFNRSLEKAPITFDFSLLHLNGIQQVRDLWRQKNIIQTKGNYTAIVNPHGTVFLKISPIDKEKAIRYKTSN
jgi:alpha-galactosidase